ncbi:N-6 DNA methylase [Paraburkholderia youngii]|uniref:N-6 DNA methylase n=1 Tax=Paraburkholderia youngii TaxID=2782701 RepID=UPI003D1E3BA9
MLDQEQKQAIDAAIWQLYGAFHGAALSSNSKELVMAMLVLKFLSDVVVEIDRRPRTDRFSEERWVVPEAAIFSSLFAQRHDPGNGHRLNRALDALESANVALYEVFEGIDFNAPSLGSTEPKELLLRQLLEGFAVAALDFRIEREGRFEAAGYACDSLIRHAAEIQGRRGRGGEFFTPFEICQLIARLMQPKAGESVCDPCCGSGSLLIACSEAARQREGGLGCALFGQEINGGAWALARMNMLLHGENQHQIAWGDTLRAPQLLSGGSLKKFAITVSSPPFSLRNWGQEEADRDTHNRYWRGIPPRAAGDYAFISHMLATLEPKVGRMAVVVAHGVLFRAAAELQIRKTLVQENLIDAVIALPPKMFTYTGIAVAIIIMRKDRSGDGVLFIDASREFQHGKNQNALRMVDLDRIESTYFGRSSVAQYSRLVTHAEIAANDYNLSVARYVKAPEDEVITDLTALRAERDLLRAELVTLERKLAALLQDVGHG